MRIKKMLALALGLSMVTTSLVACGTKGNEAKSTGSKTSTTSSMKTSTVSSTKSTTSTASETKAGGTLKLAAFEGGNGAEIWNQIKAAFETETGATVDLHLSSELDKDLTKSFQNGDIPDVVYFNMGTKSGFTETMLKEKAIADITDVFDDELKSRLVGGITDNATAQPYADGKVYLAPWTYVPTGFWYNADLIGEGKKYKLPTTWDEFFALGDEAKKDGIALFTYPTAGYFDCSMYQMLAQSGGMEFYNKAVNYDPATWTSKEGKQVIDTVAKLASKDYTWSDTVANANADGGFKKNQQAVIDGKALFMPNGNWVIGEMADSTPKDFHWAMMAQPKFSADQKTHVYTYTEQIWIPKDAANMDLAKQFIKFMYSDKVVELMLANKSVNKETKEETPAPIISPVKGASDKIEAGPVKDSYTLTSADGTEAVAGTWATTKAINGFDMGATVYGAIDSLNTGELTAETYQSQLVEAWAKLLENLDR
ncbi:MAG: carbohydrate ABC transporter substrate-binding protein [Catonella sp.]|uniref:carbohydrate ABC transporter substrate-binding protein n=1 Tax=Catonella sp. TaxID=2382125 RepID=UPI003F9FCE7D